MQVVHDAAKPRAPLCRAATGFKPALAIGSSSRPAKRLGLAVVSLVGLLLVTSGPASANKFPWEDFDKRLKASQDVAALGTDLFGDSVNLQNGGLSFSVTDISIPGNSGLRVALSRSYTVTNQKFAVHDEMLGDWVLETPSISGTFAPNWIASGTPGNRCSETTPPPLRVSGIGAVYFLSDFFNGLTLEIPGVGGGELLVTAPSASRPSSGGPYRWVTNDQFHVRCLPSIQEGTGEGFEAVGPDGTTYRFDYMAQHLESNLVKIAYGQDGTPPQQEITPRRRNLMLATSVVDRFGNWVEYEYSNAWNEPARLVSITADQAGGGDFRKITLTYGTNGRVASASDGTRTWRYTYASTPKGRITLSAVVHDDDSKWTYGFGDFSDALIKYADSYPAGEPLRGCDWLEHPHNADEKLVGTVTHPSGAIGTFTLGIHEHGRSNVPLSCANFTSPYSQNISNDDVNLFVISSHAFSLETKLLTGPEVSASWNYTYASDISPFYYPGTTWDSPVCSGAHCYEPPCTSDACAGSSRTVVTGPNNEWSRYTFGNSFRYNEGKLLKVEQGSSASNILQVRTDTFDLARADRAYPAKFGDSLQENHDGFASEYHRPLLSSDTLRQGATFSWDVEGNCVLPTGVCMDQLARAVRVRRGSTLGFARVEATAYFDDTARWVMGQTLSLKCLQATPANDACNGDVVTESTYDPATALPRTLKRFGKLQHTLDYYTDGNLKTYTDGRSNVTTLSNWYRGVPALIRHPDTTERLAAVNADGTIASVTNEVGARTCYGYKFGRLTSVTHPTETQPIICGTTDWEATTQAFTQVDHAEFGIPANHWRLQVNTGNASKTIYFDALWRPLLTREYDNQKISETLRFVRMRYDHEGRNTFTSYPADNAYSTTGTWTAYDSLGRTTSVSQDSERGVLTTLSSYPSNAFQVSVTNPRVLTTTTTAFQAWDQPSYDLPLTIQQPESATTTFTRDAWGKIKTLTRGGPNINATRSYTYNDHQELCRQFEPETDVTLMDYDGAGNLGWSASGLPPSLDCASGPNHTQVAARRADRTYDVRNRLTNLTFADTRGDQVWTYTADGLPATVVTYNGYNHTESVTSAFNYNARRMLNGQGESIHQQNSYTWSYGYGYDKNGHLAANVYPSGLSVSYAPNALGQPTRVGPYASGVTYHPSGTVRQFTYGNGVVHNMKPNLRGLPELSVDVLGGYAVLDDTYTYDENGNVTKIADLATEHDGRGNRSMTYDGLDRLKTAISPMWGNQAATYTYNALYNLSRVQVPAATPSNPAHDGRDHYYCYDEWNHLTNIKTGGCGGSTVGALGYDVQGNLENKDGTEFDFDHGNRLRRVGTKLNDPIHQALIEKYRYDGFGRRVLTLTPTTGLHVNSHYSNDGRLIYQYDTNTSERVDYMFLGNRLVATRTRPLTASTETVEYQHTDGLGSTVAVSDATGQRQRYDEYEPYGLRINRVNDNRPGYTGHVMDAATGLTYMQQRYYDPGIGMFLSVDPITAYSDPIGQFHRYRYANNNPYKFTDPDGRFAAPGFVIGVALELGRQAITGEIKDTSIKGVAKNVGKALIAGGAGATGGGIATGVARLTTSMAARSLANGAAGATIGATSRVATNAVEGQALGEGVGMSAVTGGAAGAAGSAVGDILEGPVAQRLANATGNFIGTSSGQVAAPAVASGLVSDAAAASTVVSNSPGVVEAAASAVGDVLKPPPPPAEGRSR